MQLSTGVPQPLLQALLDESAAIIADAQWPALRTLLQRIKEEPNNLQARDSTRHCPL